MQIDFITEFFFTKSTMQLLNTEFDWQAFSGIFSDSFV